MCAVAVTAAVCALAVGCGAQKQNVTTTTERIESEVVLSVGGGKATNGLPLQPQRPLTRVAAAREARAYVRRHLGAVVDVRCARVGRFMACSFRRGAGCAMLTVEGAYNGATPVVIGGVVAAPQSSCR